MKDAVRYSKEHKLVTRQRIIEAASTTGGHRRGEHLRLRGAGRSPGRLDIFSPREVRGYYDAIEWAGVQRWSNGKVGLNGISYYAINQWLVAALQPPHLAAMIPWEGAADFYRDWARHGGIMSNAFLEVWYPRQVTFDALGEPVTFLSAPLSDETELTGPLVATLYVSSSTTDADLFVTLQAFAPDGREVDFLGTIDPHTPMAQGWLRGSHRKIDPDRSKPYRPFHSHDELQPLEPGEVYRLDVEIWPTCIVLPAGYRLGLQIGGHDFEREPPDDPNEAWVSRGSGPWLHTHPEDRPESVYGGRTTIHTGGTTPSSLLLPVIPAREASDETT